VGRPTIKVKFKFSRNMLIRILSQQLANWRARPQSAEECLTLASEYLTEVIASDHRRLRQLYAETADEEEDSAGRELLGDDDSWQEAHATGLKFREQAAEIVDEFFPHLAPAPQEHQQEQESGVG